MLRRLSSSQAQTRVCSAILPLTFMASRTSVGTNHTVKLTRAQRLQLGNLRTDYGELQTAAGSQEKWGFLYKGWRYPIIGQSALFLFMFFCWATNQSLNSYRDCEIYSEHTCYEDVHERMNYPMQGHSRLKSLTRIKHDGDMFHYDPTPLEWLPFELKLAPVSQASV